MIGARDASPTDHPVGRSGRNRYRRGGVCCCRSGEQGWRSEAGSADPAAASTLLLLPFLESCHPLVVFGSLLGLLAALLLEVVVGDDRFGGSYRRSDLGYGLALLFAVVESGVEAGGERLCLGLAGLAFVQPGLVVVVGDQRLETSSWPDNNTPLSLSAVEGTETV